MPRGDDCSSAERVAARDRACLRKATPRRFRLPDTLLRNPTRRVSARRFRPEARIATDLFHSARSSKRTCADWVLSYVDARLFQSEFAAARWVSSIEAARPR